MEKQKFSFRTGLYFPGTFIALGIILCCISIILIVQSSMFFGILLLFGIILLTSHYLVEIDFEHQTYSESIWLLGF